MIKQIPLQRNVTLTATKILLFMDNPTRRSFIIQNTGTSNSLAISFDGLNDSIVLSAGQSLVSGSDDKGGADYKGELYASSSAGTTVAGIEVSK